MLTWNKTIRQAQSGRTVSEGYTAQIPHWGRASIHPHIHHPGEMFLDCPALGIDMHPLGHVLAEDTWDPANAVLLRTLRDHGIWCLEAMAAIGAIDAARATAFKLSQIKFAGNSQGQWRRKSVFASC